MGMANVLNEEKKQQVLALGRLGWSLRRIQQATIVRRETASAYLKAAGIAVRPPSGWGRRRTKTGQRSDHRLRCGKTGHAVIPDPLDPNVNCNPNPENLSTKGKAKATSKPANENEVITDSGRGPSRPPVPASRTGKPSTWGSAAAAMPWRSGRTWSPSTASPAATRACSASCASCAERKRPKPASVIVTAPGQEAQVDYGTGPMVRDPETRKYRRTRLFVMTLGCSRKSVRLLTFRSSSRIWAELHEKSLSPAGRRHAHRRAR